MPRLPITLCKSGKDPNCETIFCKSFTWLIVCVTSPSIEVNEFKLPILLVRLLISVCNDDRLPKLDSVVCRFDKFVKSLKAVFKLPRLFRLVVKLLRSPNAVCRLVIPLKLEVKFVRLPVFKTDPSIPILAMLCCNCVKLPSEPESELKLVSVERLGLLKKLCRPLRPLSVDVRLLVRLPVMLVKLPRLTRFVKLPKLPRLPRPPKLLRLPRLPKAPKLPKLVDRPPGNPVKPDRNPDSPPPVPPVPPPLPPLSRPARPPVPPPLEPPQVPAAAPVVPETPASGDALASHCDAGTF